MEENDAVKAGNSRNVALPPIDLTSPDMFRVQLPVLQASFTPMPHQLSEVLFTLIREGTLRQGIFHGISLKDEDSLTNMRSWQFPANSSAQDQQDIEMTDAPVVMEGLGDMTVPDATDNANRSQADLLASIYNHLPYVVIPLPDREQHDANMEDADPSDTQNNEQTNVPNNNNMAPLPHQAKDFICELCVKAGRTSITPKTPDNLYKHLRGTMHRLILEVEGKGSRRNNFQESKGQAIHFSTPMPPSFKGAWRIDQPDVSTNRSNPSSSTTSLQPDVPATQPDVSTSTTRLRPLNRLSDQDLFTAISNHSSADIVTLYPDLRGREWNTNYLRSRLMKLARAHPKGLSRFVQDLNDQRAASGRLIGYLKLTARGIMEIDTGNSGK